MSEVWFKPGTKRLAKGWKWVKGQDAPEWVGEGPDPRKAVSATASRKFLPRHLW